MALQLKVPNMACDVCVTTIISAIKVIDADAIIAANPKTKLVDIETKVTEAVVRETLDQAGYPAAV